MTARVVALVLAWVVVVAGCTTPNDQPPPSTSPRATAQQGPRDRDEEAVLAALRRIDLCEVLAAAMSETPGLPAGAEPRARQPFACVADGISAKAVSSTHETRLSLPSQDIGGARAYVREERDGCAVLLPVSFELAVEFSQVPGTCQVVTGLTAAAVSVLADPEAARVDPRWDACTVLAEALGPDTDRAKLAGPGLDDCTDFSEAPSQASISFADGLPPAGQPRTATIGDTQVQIYEQETSCDLYWRQGPTPDHQVLVVTPDCDRSTALAESVLNVLAGQPPTDAQPQWPLFYARDEPDSPLPGACAYVDGVSAPGRCEPYREAPVPDDIPASGDANVMCAVAVDAVAEQFGTRLRPVAVTDAGIDDCYFAAPERSIQLEFTVKPGPAAREPGDREVAIAGHSGFVVASGGSYRYQLSASRTATVRLTVRTGPVIAADTPLPAGTDKKAEAVLTDVLREYFP
jgi:hypothetical protein